MPRAVIADDERLMREQLRARLTEVWPELEIVAEAKNGLEAVALTEQYHPDIVFLDIRMPGLTGVDAARQIAQLPTFDEANGWPGCEIVFITAYDQYALKAFEAGAVDYLLKPIDELRFGEALARARDLLRLRALDASRTKAMVAVQARPLQKFMVRIGSRTLFIRADAVEWISADGDYAVLHSGARTYMVRESLHQLVMQLDQARFLRVHRSSIVRLDQVAEFQPLTNRDAMLRLHDGTPVRVSRTYVDALLSALHAAD